MKDELSLSPCPLPVCTPLTAREPRLWRPCCNEAQPVLFLPAASGFFYNADQSQTQPYDALFWKRKSAVIVRKRAEWPLPSWAGGMRWRAKVLQKQDGRSRLPLPFMSPMGVTQCSLLAFRLLCAPPLLSSLSLHHFVLFFFFRDQLPPISKFPLLILLTQLGGRASRTQRQEPSGTAEVDSGCLKDTGADKKNKKTNQHFLSTGSAPQRAQSQLSNTSPQLNPSV